MNARLVSVEKNGELLMFLLSVTAACMCRVSKALALCKELQGYTHNHQSFFVNRVKSAIKRTTIIGVVS